MSRIPRAYESPSFFGYGEHFSVSAWYADFFFTDAHCQDLESDSFFVEQVSNEVVVIRLYAIVV